MAERWSLHKGCVREAPLRGNTLGAGGIGTGGLGAEGIGARGIGAEGIGAGGIGAGGTEDRSFKAPNLGGTLDDPGKRCLWKKAANR